jgi:hypothetical protein
MSHHAIVTIAHGAAIVAVRGETTAVLARFYERHGVPLDAAREAAAEWFRRYGYGERVPSDGEAVPAGEIRTEPRPGDLRPADLRMVA